MDIRRGVKFGALRITAFLPEQAILFGLIRIILLLFSFYENSLL